MFSESIIEKLNIFEGMASGLVFSDKGLVSYRRGFVFSVERFHCCIIITVSFRAHALLYAEFFDELTVLLAGIGAATVTM
jgi:hypothetical protein